MTKKFLSLTNLLLPNICSKNNWFIIYLLLMFKQLFSKLFVQDFHWLLKTSWANILGISIFVGFLLFLLNIFLWVSLYANQLSGDLKDKLGMYFYIKDTTTQTWEINARVISLKDDLEAAWLKVTFSSKDDALAFLQKKVPDVVSNFAKFGIDNPLPATLYVMFDDDDTYESLKTIILNNKDIILNTKDVDSWTTIKQQENRVLTIINLSNFVVRISYVIIAILLAMIISFLWFLLKNVFHTFHKELAIKKILWATYNQIVQGFVSLTTNVLLFSFVICLALLLISGITINFYIYTLFDITLWSVFHRLMLIIGLFLIEVVVVAGCGYGFSYFFARELNKQL